MTRELTATPIPIVAPEHFVLATRDTGYRSVAAAISELVDNSIQAHAAHVDVLVREVDGEEHLSVVLGVVDDGVGIPPAKLGSALQFGGTSRFDDRSGLGRYGMGLPNSSVSHSRRVEVYSWLRPSEIYQSYLDVDEVVAGRLQWIPPSKRSPLPAWVSWRGSASGTLVLWTRCDRLGRYRVDTLVRRLHTTLGRVYRYAIWNGIHITVNAKPVQPFDPLFIDTRAAIRGARAYGPALRYELKGTAGPSIIEARFSELPIHKWHHWSAEEKRRKGIVGGAGVSVIRAGREIDYGWHLLGGKRRENYDDWWRCEIRFSPDLDEFFGVTHSKQGVTPTSDLKLLLSPDLEAIARTLNRRVRQQFDRAKNASQHCKDAELRGNDALLAPPASLVSRKIAADGLRYRLEYKPIPEPEFYAVRVTRASIVVTVNTDHPFFTEIHQRASQPGGCGLDRVERLVLAAARADLEARDRDEREHTIRLRRAWSDALAAFLRSK